MAREAKVPHDLIVVWRDGYPSTSFNNVLVGFLFPEVVEIQDADGACRYIPMDAVRFLDAKPSAPKVTT